MPRKNPPDGYGIWNGMKDRCLNEGNKDYARYGGRGITVCPRWLESFDNFIADMGARPSKSHTVERVDNNAGYCPENCRWATRKEQANNRSSNVHFTYGGVTKNLRQWSRESGVDHHTIAYRINRGLPPEKVLSNENFTGAVLAEANRSRSKVTRSLIAEVKSMRAAGATLKAIEKKLGISNGVVYKALKSA